MRSVIENTESGNFNSPDVKLSWHGPDKVKEKYILGGKKERENGFENQGNDTWIRESNWEG